MELNSDEEELLAAMPVGKRMTSFEVGIAMGGVSHATAFSILAFLAYRGLVVKYENSRVSPASKKSRRVTEWEKLPI